MILAAAILPEMQDELDEPLSELRRLAETAGAEIIGELTQRMVQPHQQSFLGKGKAESLAAMAAELDADAVIFDNDLSPAQIRNLERIVECKVLDRSELILDIFATHAQTKQARLQVELAQLEYTMPRLLKMWTHLEKIEGGIGVRGPGERQLETDRRLVRRRVGKLKEQIEEISKRKERQMASREAEFSVSLVGYTNAGKSTLMNALTNADTLVEDKLFATLDTCTRAWQIDPHRRVLLSDTVGFIRRLPHHLVASFHATLEEAIHADLLLHVVDAGHIDCEGQIEAANDVLKQIGCEHHPMLMVFNKIDTIADESIVPLLRDKYPDSVWVSARTGAGIDTLQDAIREMLDRREVHLAITTHCGNGKLLSYLAENAKVLEQEYVGDEVRLEVVVEPRHLGQIGRLAENVRRL